MPQPRRTYDPTASTESGSLGAPAHRERPPRPVGPRHLEPMPGPSPEPARPLAANPPNRRRGEHATGGNVTPLPHLPAACALPDLPEPYREPRQPAESAAPSLPAGVGPQGGAPLVQALPLRDGDAPGGAPLTGYLLLVPSDALPADPTALATRAVAVQPQSIRPLTPTAGQPAATPAGTAAAAPPDGCATGTGLPTPPRPRTPHGLVLDPDRRVAELDGRQLDLTYLEFELLHHLVAHPYRVHSRSQLVTAVWGYGHVGDGRTVDVHIARLRRKLGPHHRRNIVTVRRVGYKYLPTDAC